MSERLDTSPAVIGIYIGKNAQVVQSFVSHLPVEQSLMSSYLD